MPRRATRPGPPTLLLGVWGQGETSPENIAALLDDFIDGAGKVTPKFVVPLSTDHASDGVLAAFDYAVEKGYDVTVVYTKKPASKVLKGYLEKADNEHVAADPIEDDERFESTEDAIGDHFATLLGEKGDDARLLFLWDEDDKGEPNENDQRVLAAVADCGVVALDLGQGLEVLDVDPPEDEPGDGDDKGSDDEPAADDKGGEDEPDYDTVQSWPIRRIRTYAKKIAQQDREDGEEAPSDEELDDSEQYNKEGLLDYLFPADDGEDKKEPEPEPEPPKKETSGRRRRTPADEDKGVTPERAKEMREEGEADGTDSTSRNRRKAAASKPSEPEDGPEAGSEGEDGSDALERFKDALADLSTALANSDEEAENQGWVDFADAFADVIIDRIAARVEKEPEGSDVRKEIAPPRPPGKPRKDGATPTRRRTASRR